MKERFAFLTLLVIFVFFARPAPAQVLYDNGPTNGTTDAWTINLGYSVSDSFNIPYYTSVTQFSFAAWLDPGDVLQSAELSVTQNEFGGTLYFDETLSFTQSGCISNQYGYDVCTETAYFNPIMLNSGTYWVSLSNAMVAGGNPVYWDENSGPSSASENTLGTIPSESFTVLGGCTGCGESTPEPASWLMFGSGAIALLASGLRKRI